jgi:dephospho-CoA kinase
MKKRKIFIIVGMPGSGKGTAAKIVKEKFSAELISTGDILREEVRRRGLKNTPENDKKLRIWFNMGHEHIYGRRTWAKIKKTKGNLIVIESPRAPGHVDEINRLAGYKIPIIYIYVPFNLRAKRMLKRHRFKHETIAYLKDRDNSELKVGMGKVIKRAKYRVSNRGTRKDLERNIIKLFKKLTR